MSRCVSPGRFRRWITVSGELLLMPLGVGKRRRAGFVEPYDLGFREAPMGGRQIVAKLLLVAHADDHCAHAGLVHDPIERYLRSGNPAPAADLEERVHDSIEPLRFDNAGRFELIQTGFRRTRVAPEFSAKQAIRP